VRRAAFAFLPAFFYAGLIFYLSAQPHPLPFLPRSLLSHDKLLHILEYAGFAAFLAWGLLALPVPPLRTFLVALFLASA
jgi:hypothetical protein